MRFLGKLVKFLISAGLLLAAAAAAVFAYDHYLRDKHPSRYISPDDTDSEL